MLGLAIGLFVLAIIAALFGFDLVASTFAAAARIIFFVLLVLFIISLIAYLF
jgi:uncharacterized membrane protein YtjA (UPF0391 family)